MEEVDNFNLEEVDFKGDESVDDIPIFDNEDDSKIISKFTVRRKEKKLFWKTVTLFSLYFSLTSMHLQSILFPIVLPYLVADKLITTPESGIIVGSGTLWYENSFLKVVMSLEVSLMVC
jgi:hypothetical protein